MKIINSFLLALLLSTTSLFAQTDLKNGLVACYPFNANANDATGNGNNGTVNGATLTTDRFGKVNNAYYFDGISNYIEISADKLQTSTFSYSVWVKLSSIPQSGIAYIFLSIGSQSGDQVLSVNHGYSNASNGFTGGGYVDIGENAICQQGFLPNANEWYHVVLVRENNIYKTYLNGVLMCISPFTSKSPFYGTGTVKATIGCRNNYGQFTEGSLDDIHIYNRPLNAAEVKALYEGNSAANITINVDKVAPCGGDNITFTANGASSTTQYRWKIDGVNVGTNSKFFVYNSSVKSTDYQVKISVEVTGEECFPDGIATVENTIMIKNCNPCIDGIVACFPFTVVKTK